MGEGMRRPGKSVWMALAVAAALVIGAAGLASVVTVVPVVLKGDASLSEFRTLPVGRLITDDPSLLDDLHRQVREVRADVSPASRLARWVGRLVPVVSWLPIVDEELSAWARQMGRVKDDVDAASSLLDSSTALIATYNETKTAFIAAEPGRDVAALGDDVDDLRRAFDTDRRAVEDARRAGRAFSLAMQAPGLRGNVRLLGDLEDRMLQASTIGSAVSALMVELLRLAEQAQPLVGQFVTDESDPDRWNTETLKATLTAVERHATSARAQAEEVAELIPESADARWLDPQLEDLDRVLEALLIVNGAGMTSLAAVESAEVDFGGSGRALLSGDGGLVEILDAFAERGDEMAKAVADLEKAQRVIDELGSGGSGVFGGSALADLSRYVDDLHSGLALIHEVAPLGRELVGADGIKRYLVLGQSADELRGTGGFVSSVWLVTFDHQELAAVEYFDAVRVDDWERLMLYPKAPPGLDEHMNAWVWLLREISWDPDFPTTARGAEDMFRLGQHREVDGVIAINQWTLLRLVEALGDIPRPIDGAPVTVRNLLSVLEDGTDRHGRAYMDLIVQGLIDKFNGPMSIPVLTRLASGLKDTLQVRDMLLYFDDSRLQAMAARMGWDGTVRQSDGDYLFVVDSNVGWSKVDRNIQRDITYLVDLSREQQPRARLTVGYTNHSGPGSPGCEPQWRNRGTNYSQLKNACYWNYLRVYMPQGVRVLSTTPLPLAEQTVSVEIGRGVPGQETGRTSSSHNKTVFSGLTSLEAGRRSGIDIVYDLPASVVDRSEGNLLYELVIQKQPGVPVRDVEIAVIPPKGYVLSASSMDPRRRDSSPLAFLLPLTEDSVLNLEFTRSADGAQ